MKPEVLHKLHEIEIEMLDEIDRICKKHHITYFLSGGTLLGAVRHKGFIPWDDDIDIALLRKDYDKFQEICKTELSDKFELSSEKTKNYILQQAKLQMRNTVFLEKGCLNNKNNTQRWGIFVDIFPLDNAKSGYCTRIQYKIAQKMNYCLEIKLELIPKKTIKYKLVRFFMRCINIELWKKFRDSICKLQNVNDNCTYVARMGSSYSIETMRWLKEKLFPVSQIEFEGKMYPAPHDPHYFLQKKYGIDYMQLPPIEKRRTHDPVKISFNIAEGFVDL